MTDRRGGYYLFALAICIFGACGGSVRIDGANGNAGASSVAGSTSSAGDTSRAGASAVAGSFGTSGSGSNGSAGASASAVCTLAWDSGNCDGFFPSWGHDAKTGLCLPFVYGGCGGNGNRFATRDECNAACPELGENFDKC